MRSIPQALLWETLSRGRWSLPGLFLLGNGLPLLVYGSLYGSGIKAADPIYVILQFSLLPLVILQFAMGISIAQGPMSRLYTWPVSSNTIVAWHTLSGAAILALETALAACLYNWLFDAQWPILGPMLFAAVAWSAFQLLQFIPTQNSVSVIFLWSCPLFLSLLWLMSRYGSWISPPTHYWREVTFVDGAFLSIAAATCYALTKTGVQYSRSNEPFPRLGISTWLIARWESLTLGTWGQSRFRSAVDAQLWYEFILKGWALPFLTAVVMFFPLITILVRFFLPPRNWDGVVELVLAFGAVQSALALIFGILFSLEYSTNRSDKRDEGFEDLLGTFYSESMGSFLAVRPIENRMFSNIILWTIAKSTALSSVIWLAGLIAVLLVMWLKNQTPVTLTVPGFGAWLLPLAILGPWICMANAASFAFIAAHRGLIFLVVGIATVSLLLLIAIAQLPREVFLQISVVGLSIVSVLVVMLTSWVFYRSGRANQLTSATQVLSVSLAIGILVAAFLLRPTDPPLVAFPLTLAIAALAILPFAALPLAIGASRHR
ncbi:MAG: hypothetical protein WCI02_00620 [Planctomycetota bacterium]